MLALSAKGVDNILGTGISKTVTKSSRYHTLHVPSAEPGKPMVGGEGAFCIRRNDETKSRNETTKRNDEIGER